MAETILADGCSDSVEEKSLTASEPKKEDVFKKPSFIGPKKVIKKSSSAPNSDVVSAENQEAKDNADTVSKNTAKPESRLKNLHPLPYTEPMWKGTTDEVYTLEELKSGVIQSVTKLQKKSLITFGRIECCDVVLAHPTVSRYHAVLQYRGVPDGEEGKGFYLYDLESTHGTFLNKARIKPRIYVRVKVGYMIKFGCSSRFFLLQGPEYDQEEESEMTFSEMKEKRRQELEEKKRKEEEELRLQEEEEERRQKAIEERGVSWGLGEDADEEEDLSENPYAVTNNEELYIDDPKKALRQWFEREGQEMQLETEQVEKGLMACKIVLPLDDETGRDIIVESSGRSKKEAQTQCCMDACRIIDRMGMFRQAKQEAKKVRTKNWEENDFYDSDEDSFLDRTGDLDIKRQRRMRKVGKISETVETYESLSEKHKSVVKVLEEAERKLQTLLAANEEASECENENLDALDAFMKNLKDDKPTKLDIKIAKEEVAKLKKEEDHLIKLINIVKPTNLPELKPFVPAKSNIKNLDKKSAPEVLEDTHSTKIKKFSDPSSEDNEEPPKKKKVFGPSLSETLILTNNEPEKTITDTSQNQKKKSNRKKQKTASYEEASKSADEDYVNLVWQPPKGQTGDGRTSLNDKLGY